MEHKEMNREEMNRIIKEAMEKSGKSFSFVDYRDLKNQLSEILKQRGYEIIDDDTSSRCSSNETINIKPLKNN